MASIMSCTRSNSSLLLRNSFVYFCKIASVSSRVRASVDCAALASARALPSAMRATAKASVQAASTSDASSSVRCLMQDSSARKPASADRLAAVSDATSRKELARAACASSSCTSARSARATAASSFCFNAAHSAAAAPSQRESRNTVWPLSASGLAPTHMLAARSGRGQSATVTMLATPPCLAHAMQSTPRPGPSSILMEPSAACPSSFAATPASTCVG
mmetsp:Transcript_54524/g.137636  ORF Transcript_54524/g.137636 Transcript_54524/m.137636 type:complete len:220 (+) Transcript_54524:2802-3461(+)